MEPSNIGMDDTTREIIERITVRFDKPTVIRSGHSCSVYYDCIQLTPSELARLAAQAVGHLPDHTFDMAIGLAYYGIFFAAAVSGGRQVGILQADGRYCGPSIKDKKIILVDDVVYSGQELSKAEGVISEMGANVIGFACVVDRSEGRARLKKPLWSAYQTNMV